MAPVLPAGDTPGNSGAYGSAGESSTRPAETGKYLYAQHRPWSEFLNRGAFRRPESLRAAAVRLRKNLSYFRVNYAVALLAMVFLSILWHPASLIVLFFLLVVWIFLYFFRNEPLVIFRRRLSDACVLLSLSAATLAALLLTGRRLNIVAAVLIGAVLMVIHGLLRVSDDLFMDEEEAAAGGLLWPQAATASAATATRGPASET